MPEPAHIVRATGLLPEDALQEYEAGLDAYIAAFKAAIEQSLLIEGEIPNDGPPDPPPPEPPPPMDHETDTGEPLTDEEKSADEDEDLFDESVLDSVSELAQRLKGVADDA
jgi:hypothetical protein